LPHRRSRHKAYSFDRRYPQFQEVKWELTVVHTCSEKFYPQL
jgi:hypothetical protein